jgi:hypothetical protein
VILDPAIAVVRYLRSLTEDQSGRRHLEAQARRSRERRAAAAELHAQLGRHRSERLRRGARQVLRRQREGHSR